VDAKGFYVEGLRHISAGDYGAAEAAFRKAVEADPAFVIGHLGISQALDRQGKVDAAIEAVRRAIEIDPAEPLAHTSLSRLYQQKGLIDEAEKEMAESVRLQAGSSA
jgi:superkiller protein 3